MDSSNITASMGGRITKGATLQRVGNSPVCNFTVGTGRGDAAESVRCSLWGKRGEVLAEYLVQRMPVHVSGTLGRNVYEGVTSLTLNVAEIVILSNVDALQREREHYHAQRAAQQHQPPAQQEMDIRQPGKVQGGKRNLIAEGGGPNGDEVIEGPGYGRGGRDNG